jgi:hypothetical protein
VPPDDVTALAAGIGRFLDDRWMAAACGHAARRTVQQRFSLRRMVAATEQLYADLLRHRSARKQAA